MKKDFIKVNNSIYDYDVYQKDVILVKNYIRHHIQNLLKGAGFRLDVERREGYSNLIEINYNEKTDLEVIIQIKKRKPEEFI